MLASSSSILLPDDTERLQSLWRHISTSPDLQTSIRLPANVVESNATWAHDPFPPLQSETSQYDAFGPVHHVNGDDEEEEDLDPFPGRDNDDDNEEEEGVSSTMSQMFQAFMQLF